ncbi:MAG: hypothetical protein LUQ25_02185 [Methanoregulaceae archaeon]|nr:hypothetical protein [Methanoregulaceae archaeon]
MTESYSRPAFELDSTHTQILAEVSARPGCTISHVVLRLLPEHGENNIRSRVHQLLTQRYLAEVKGCHGIQLRVTGKGRVSLQPEKAE